MIYFFGDFALDTERYELRNDGEAIAAEPKVLEVLAFLAANRRRVVSKDELIEKVWSGRFVSDSAVSRAIREVRRILGDSAADSRWVKTVYGRGFAFVGELEESTGDPPRAEAHGEQPDGGDVAVGRSPLPAPMTPLIGRERELRDVRALLSSARLITLTGAGGSGKTRLALELAHHNSERFPGGAIFVALADLADSELVANAIGRSLGVGDAVGATVLEANCKHIGSLGLLLVLDNFEHILDARGAVTELLQSCPNLVVLVTSRFVLQLEGEQEYTVPPLALPEGVVAEDEPTAAPSVALFLERARAVRHDFDPQGRELAYIAEICRKLDGLPLAIELAAARVKVLSPSDLWQRLAERSDLLSAAPGARPQRHRTLELTLSWSYELLDEAERGLLQRLSVFAGGCTLPAAEQICRAPGVSVLDTLSALVDKSLVTRFPDGTGEVRFRLLETTREFARTQLEADGKEELRNTHAQWALDLARRGASNIAAGDQERWLKRLDAEHGNLMAALGWARTGGDPTVGLATATAMARYWSARGTYREGRRELEQLLTLVRQEKVEPAAMTEAQVALGLLCHLLCDYSPAEIHLREAIGSLRTLNDRRGLAEALNHLGWVVVQGIDLAAAEPLVNEALELHREFDNARGISVALNNLGWAAMIRGEADLSEELLSDSLNQRRAAGDDRGVAFALANLAIVRLHLTERWDEVGSWLEEARCLVDPLGDPPLSSWVLFAEGGWTLRQGQAESAIPMLEESAALSRDHGHRDGQAWSLLWLGEACEALGQHAEARRLLEEVETIWSKLGVPWGVAQALWRLAEIHHEEGNPRAARKLLGEAIELFDRLGATAHLNSCRSELAEIEE